MEPIVFLPLNRGLVAVIDFSDFEKIREFKWSVILKKSGRKYVYRSSPRDKKGRRRSLYLSRELISPAPRQTVDHVNGDTLDHRRKNLRPCTHRQNQRGFKKKSSGASSRYRGVTWSRSREKWVAQIQLDGKTYNLGGFFSELEAARAYDEAATRFGFFPQARNF